MSSVRKRRGAQISIKNSERHAARIDWWGNITLAGALTLIMIGITSGIQPYQHHAMSWAIVPLGMKAAAALPVRPAILRSKSSISGPSP